MYFKNYAKKCEAKILERISSKGKGCMCSEPRSVSILLSLFICYNITAHIWILWTV